MGLKTVRHMAQGETFQTREHFASGDNYTLSSAVNCGFSVGLVPLRSFENPSYDRIMDTVRSLYRSYVSMP